ncbi:MAG: malectin, partial [Deinococcota bacterium]|nr:malectin [Deinococcota bacterium]
MINTVQHDIGGKQNGQTRIWILLLALGLLLTGCGTVTQERPSLTEELTEEADFDTANLGEAVARINAGGPAVTTSGVRWSADQHFSGGRTYSNSNVKSIANTRDTALYLRGRVPPANGNGRMSYSIPVPAKGQYIVRLHFAEIYWGSPGWGSRGGAGTRVFSVDLEKGSARLRNYDIFRDVGPRRAVIKSYEVTVNDGRLNLDFSASKDRPKIAAIEVYRKAAGSTTKPPQTSPSAPRPSPSPEPKAPSTRPSNSGNGSMRGNPSFSESQLPAEVRTWYRRMWGFINNRNQIPNHRAMASSGDLNHYARNLNKYHTTLLAIFRSTGDLRILDEIARNAQSMYNTLRDTDRDGYRNWQFKGKNVARPMLEEPMAHGHVAALVYALNANRGLSSPSGIDYGRLADNLLGYLRNDFEPKWRERSAQRLDWQGSEFPYLRATNHHAYVNLMRYHDYMYKLTGERGYRDYLDTMSSVIRRDVRDISTPIGTALVWGGRLSSD